MDPDVTNGELLPPILVFAKGGVRGTVTVGDTALCDDWRGPRLHACKHPCFIRRRTVMEHEIGTQPFARGGPFYLAIETTTDLFLNLIDPPLPLFQRESFEVALRWLDRRVAEGHDVLVHCNQGLSRAPSVALLWAVRAGWTPAFPDAAASFAAAAAGLLSIWPAYHPGEGLVTFLTEHWPSLVAVTRVTEPPEALTA